jgi:uncharacterized protein (TIGR00369 family)
MGNLTEVSDVKAAWIAEEEAVRKRYAAPGTSDRATIGRHDGLGFLRAMMRGELPYPPILDTLNFVMIEFDKGRALFQGTPQFAHYNPIGSVHGGWYCAVLDSALGCAVHSTLPHGKGYTTLELKVNLIRPLSDSSGPVRAEGRIIHAGGQTAVAEATLFDSAGKLYASATTTCLIFDIPQ